MRLVARYPIDVCFRGGGNQVGNLLGRRDPNRRRT
jgi:hypothetical protein